MEEETNAPTGSPLDLLAKEDLSLQGLEELTQRMALLTAEIERTKAMHTSKKGSRTDAEALFNQ